MCLYLTDMDMEQFLAIKKYAKNFTAALKCAGKILLMGLKGHATVA